MAARGTILLADDDAIFLETTAELLRRAGYACDGVSDSAHAVTQLGLRRYDLLIADIMMPGNDDLGLVRRLPALARGLPVILLTGFPSLHTAMRSVELPVVAYLAKPFSQTELISYVQRAIDRGRAYQAMVSLKRRLDDPDTILPVDRLEQLLKTPPPWDNAHEEDEASKVRLINDLSGALDDMISLINGLGTTQPFRMCYPAQCARLDEMAHGLEVAVTVLGRTEPAPDTEEIAALHQRLKMLLDVYTESRSTNAVRSL